MSDFNFNLAEGDTKRTICTLPEEINQKRVKKTLIRFWKNRCCDVREKVYYSIFKLYSKMKSLEISLLTEIVGVEFNTLEIHLIDLRNIGVLDYCEEKNLIELKVWQRRSRVIVPRNFMRQLIELNIQQLERDFVDENRGGLVVNLWKRLLNRETSIKLLHAA